MAARRKRELSFYRKAAGESRPSSKQVNIPTELHDKLRETAVAMNLSIPQCIEKLHSFYSMQDYELLLAKFAWLRTKGLDARDLNFLSILYSYLEHIDSNIGLN